MAIKGTVPEISVDVDGAAQPVLSLVEIPRAVVDPTQAVQVGGVVRIDGDRTDDQLQRLLEMYLAVGPHVTQVVGGIGVVRFLCHQATEELL